MLTDWYARWMYAWETRLTMRDENRVVRPLEWGFEWLVPFLEANGFAAAIPDPELSATSRKPKPPWSASTSCSFATATNSSATSAPRTSGSKHAIRNSSPPTSGPRPSPEMRHSSSRPPKGKLQPAQFLRFTSPERTPYPENDLVNARWYPAPAHKDPARPKQAIIVLPQWNSDGFSHNSLCPFFNRMGVSALRLSMPYHDIRRPAELQRSDYAVSANIGRTLSACRQAVVDIRCCLDWLEEQGYEHFGVLGTSLGSCYAFLASAHDPRLRVNAFNHASTAFGDVVWAGQSTRHIRQAVEAGGPDAGPAARSVGRGQPGQLLRANLPAPKPADRARACCMVYANYDLTFPREYSLQGGRGLPQLRIELRSARAALRPLHHRRNALQIHRRMVHGLVCLSRVQGAAQRKGGWTASCRRANPREREEEAVSR